MDTDEIKTETTTRIKRAVGFVKKHQSIIVSTVIGGAAVYVLTHKPATNLNAEVVYLAPIVETPTETAN